MVIPNGVSGLFLAKPYTGDYIREKYNISRDALVLGFVGMIEFWVNMTPVLEAVRALGRDREVKLLLVGRQFQSAAEDQLEKEIRELGIGNSVIWPDRFVPYEELPNYIAAMDLCSIPFNDSHPTAYFSAPNKLWEYFALAKPVITSPLPEVLIQAQEFVNVGTTGQDYERIVRDYVAHPDRYKEKAEASQRLAAKRTWGAISEQYEELLASVATRQVH
jgi:glycosyltransferase involved in cell wall biosynthesis